ncbi:hypothetical protein [Photobacterium aquimaris]|uniref:hypothetical protein n=1 Tax=Photobacterium aquimaris TaxID=512643 RepID=UPI0013902087|nr:hypothetical protein [Photobacterium aquimaris]
MPNLRNTDFTPKETKAMVAYLKTLTNPNCHDINGQQVCNSAKDQVWKQVTGRKLPTETYLNCLLYCENLHCSQVFLNLLV